MFSRSVQGKRAGVQLEPVTLSFTQTAEHGPGGLPLADRDVGPSQVSAPLPDGDVGPS